MPEVASCVFLWGLQRAVAPMRSVGGPGCWLEDLPQSSSWQAGWEPRGWSWVTTGVAASLAGLRLSAWIALLCRVTACAGGSLLAARGCPGVPASGLPSLSAKAAGDVHSRQDTSDHLRDASLTLPRWRTPPAVHSNEKQPGSRSAPLKKRCEPSAVRSSLLPPLSFPRCDYWSHL